MKKIRKKSKFSIEFRKTKMINMLKNKKDIKEWLDYYQIENYEILEDSTVNIHGELNLSYKKLDFIPIHFNLIEGTANFNHNFLTEFPLINIAGGALLICQNKLTSLENCPQLLSGLAVVQNNITSLKGLPDEINGNLLIFKNKITSLEFCPQIIHGGFNCSYNPLSSLKYLPRLIEKSFCCVNTLVNILTEDFTDIEIKGTIITHSSIDIKKELSELYQENGTEIYLSFEELKKYQLKEKMDKEIVEKTKISKPKI